MEKKPLLQSKIFWLSIISIVLIHVGEVMNRPYDPATGDVEENIVETIFSDPGNLLTMLINVAVIIARWFFTKTKIGGI